jgi:hypothetical protein
LPWKRGQARAAAAVGLVVPVVAAVGDKEEEEEIKYRREDCGVWECSRVWAWAYLL